MTEVQSQSNAIDVLYNDLYQFTCSFSYFQAKKHQDQATFEVFFRKYPFGGEYAIFAGLEEVRKFINSFKITNQQKDFLKQTLPELTDQYFNWIQQDFSQKIKVRAFKEGSIVFAKEPLISYSGPLGFVQMLETPILNLLGFATLVATNASRMVKAVNRKKCLEFGFRRAQGPDGGLSASIYSYLGGFSGTSNIKASQLHGIPCIGSMSHAYITSFTDIGEAPSFEINGVDIVKRSLEIRNQFGWKTHNGQLAAYLAFAKSFPNAFKTLIDTYNTLQSGLLNTIIVGKALIEAGIQDIGIRLDSGNLCQLSKKCREIWNKHITNSRLLILASDDLHESRLIEMQADHSQIDIYAIGTNIVTCKKQPALGVVCKLTQINGKSKMKLSSDIQKSTFPGKKIIYRIWTEEGEKASFDVMALEGQELTPSQLTHELYSLQKKEYRNIKIIKVIKMNEELDLSIKHTIKESRINVQKSISELSSSIFELQKAERFQVLVTKGFQQNFIKTIKQIKENNN